MKKWVNLFLANFFGVFNDNFLKNAIIFIVVSWKLPTWMTQSQLISIVSASLVIPYLIFSPLGGKLTVRYTKMQVFRFFKLIEFPIMMLASVSFLFEWTIPVIISVLLMGIQSSLYSPAKYGLIRDIGGVEGSAFGSGVFESMAFLGILLGTVVASVISDYAGNLLLILLFMGLATAGYVATIRIRVTESPVDLKEQQINQTTPWSFVYQSFRYAGNFPGLNRAVFGVSSFWLLGAILQMNIIIHATKFYQVSNTSTGIVMALAAIGIGIGTWLSGVLLSFLKSRTVILTGIGLMLVSVAVLFLKVNFTVYALMIFVAAFGGGFFQVPNLTFIQQSETGQNRGQILAYMNIIIFVFVLLGTLIFSMTTLFTHENSLAVFAVIAVIAAILFILYAFQRPQHS